MRLLFVFGTRPEAVKLAPVIRTLKARPEFETLVCLTGQHRELVESVLDFFEIHADFDLEAMSHDESLNPLLARIVQRLDALIAAIHPDRVIVQGDTSSALAGALAAFHRAVPVAHVEAGLRTYAATLPFPEEFNRRAIGLLADLHLAPTAEARDNLLAERLEGEVFVTGNSGIDALELALARLEADPMLRARADQALPDAVGQDKLILVTAHRRESFGAPFAAICRALAALAERGDALILFPLHPNPELRGPALDALGNCERVRLLPPLDLPAFVAAMQRADLILTDSGGVQEEAVALGRPVLVMREASERPEGVKIGAALTVGTDPARIVEAAARLLDAPPLSERCHVYGDGRAAGRIVDALCRRPVEEFVHAPPIVEEVRLIG